MPSDVDAKIAVLEAALGRPERGLPKGVSHDLIRSKIKELRDPVVSGAGLHPREGAGRLTAGLPPEIRAGKRSIPERFKEVLETIEGGIKAVGEAATSPIETVTNPARLSQLARGMDDVLTLGHGQKLADKAIQAFPWKRPWEEPDQGQMAEEERFRGGGQILGLGAGGLQRTVARLLGIGGAARVAPAGVTEAAAMFAQKLAGKALSKVPGAGAIPGAAKGLATGALGYEMAAPALAASHADSSGNRVGAAEDAATDPLGLFLSAGGGAVGGAARGAATRIRDPKTRSGQTIRDVEAAGPHARIRMFGKEPVQGGLYETSEFRALPQGLAGTAELAGSAEERMHGATGRGVRATMDEFGRGMDKRLGAIERSGRQVRTPVAHQALRDAAEEMKVKRGTEHAEYVGGKELGTAIATIWRHLSTLAPDPANPGRMIPHPEVSAHDLRLVRRMASDKAYAASSPYERRVLNKILSAIDEDIANVPGSPLAPEGMPLADMNRKYAAGMGQAENINDILYGKQERSVDRTTAEQKTAQQRLMRTGDETRAGLTDRVDELGQYGPEYSDELRKIRAKKAQESLRGGPETGVPIETSIARAGRMRYLLSVLGLDLGGLGGAAAGHVVGSALDAPTATAVRKVLPVAEQAGKRVTGRSGVGGDAISGIAARRGRKRREEEERQ